MNDWKDELKYVFDEYLEKRKKIDTELRSALDELKVSPYSYVASVEDSKNEPWAWDVEIRVKGIGVLKFQVRAAEILDHQQDEYGDVIGLKMPENLKSKITSLIIRKVKAELEVK